MKRAEKWRSIPGYEGYYEASTRGRIRNVGYFLRGAHRVRRRPIVLRPVRARGPLGHIRATVSKMGEKRGVRVARLVLLAFRGPPPTNRHHPHHRNRKANDNRPANLTWGIGEESLRPRWEFTDVARVRRLRREGWSLREIAPLYGVSHPTIGSLLASHGGDPAKKRKRRRA